MIELIILNHLKTKLSENVSLERPEPLLPTYVLIDKIGSSEDNQLKTSTFAFQSIAESLYEAASLNERVKTAAKSLIERSEIASVGLNSDYNFTDTQTKEYRYQAVFVIKHY